MQAGELQIEAPRARIEMSVPPKYGEGETNRKLIYFPDASL
jgi:hypothetical protein